MNELAEHNYRGQELVAPWLVSAQSEIKPQWIPRTVRPDWKMPDPPCGQNCPECGDKIEPIAHNTGDGWFFGWQCSGGICNVPALEDGMIGVWPFVEDTANWRDLENIGFVIV